MTDVPLDDLARRMEALGAPDPEQWAASEIRESIPQQARYLFLRSIWPTLIAPWATMDVVRTVPAAERLLQDGASADDLATALRAVAYETAFGIVQHLDEGHDPNAPSDAPGWVLMETK